MDWMLDASCCWCIIMYMLCILKKKKNADERVILLLFFSSFDTVEKSIWSTGIFKRWHKFTLIACILAEVICSVRACVLLQLCNGMLAAVTFHCLISYAYCIVSKCTWYLVWINLFDELRVCFQTRFFHKIGISINVYMFSLPLFLPIASIILPSLLYFL